LTGYKNSKGTAAAYAYLPNHYRMSKTVDGVLTQQIWDGNNIVAEANSANAILRSYTRGHQLLTDDDRRAYMYDGHGNLVQQNRGTAAENVTRYDAYGNKIEKSGTANDTPFGYCGEYLDKESGLIYLRNRYYDSESGRFITEDPIKNGNNWYSYCGGNPVMFLDPLGLFDYNTRLSYSQTYNEDVEVLQNELVYLNYMSAPAEDEWGYFGLKTQAAVNAYKNDMGLGNTGENYGVVGLQTWTSLGLTYRTKEDIDAGVEIVMMGGRKQYKDVSVPINNALNNSRADFEANSGDYKWFYNQVKSGAPWDIKLEKSWESTIGSTYPGSYSTKVVLFGQITTPEELGNITYGYLGSAAGFSELILLKGGDAAAAGVDLSVKGILKGIGGMITGADSEEDKNNVKIGINWYNNR
ncbi:MAG: polymorphic toxin type 44 domain-containing protein, partial [Clostridia bacterium]|nr:polymorphic toxin type 44 domain-containing protein [Clostridia bacterium]